MDSQPIAIKNSAPLALWLALGSALLSYAFAFARAFHHHYGIAAFNVPVLLGHPAAVSELMAEAFGASLLFPILHVMLFSLFKSKRNSTTRRRIFVGWSIFLVAIGLLIAFVRRA